MLILLKKSHSVDYINCVLTLLIKADFHENQLLERIYIKLCMFIHTNIETISMLKFELSHIHYSCFLVTRKNIWNVV